MKKKILVLLEKVLILMTGLGSLHNERAGAVRGDEGVLCY